VTVDREEKENDDDDNNNNTHLVNELVEVKSKVSVIYQSILSDSFMSFLFFYVHYH